MIDFNAIGSASKEAVRFEVYRDEEIRVTSTQFCGVLGHGGSAPPPEKLSRKAALMNGRKIVGQPCRKSGATGPVRLQTRLWGAQCNEAS